MNDMRKIFFTLAVLISIQAAAQQTINYSTANAHSHNDYENKYPFVAAYDAKFGSIEADIFLWNDSLIVGHNQSDIQYKRTLERLYLDPLNNHTKKNGGFPYADTSRSLQILIDIKTKAEPTLQRLIEILYQYPLLINSQKIKFTITGNRPNESLFKNYPAFIYFDAEFGKSYSEAAMQKIVMFSDDLKTYTQWNGKGVLAEKDKLVIDSLVRIAHQEKKKIRFWDAPDFINAWYQLMHEGVDYINTDQIEGLADFLNRLGKNSFSSTSSYSIYKPSYKSDGANRKVKNVILLIGDGCGWPQLYAGYTANHGNLNIFQIKNMGLSKTSSYDSYITDSAPGSTSIASGVKTKNRFVGVDHTGAPLRLLPTYLEKKKIKTGLVTCGDITDATPADFYAHQIDRDSSIAVIRDLKKSPISILMGSGNESLNNVKLLNENGRQYINKEIISELQPQFKVVNTIDNVSSETGKRWVVIDNRAGLSFLNGRGNWLLKAFEKTLQILSKNKEGFFIMTEGAQIDYGCHANDLPYAVTEVADFDQVVAAALKFADENGETLVIVTADHETGGLTLLDGDYAKGYVSGQFSTNDHTVLPVPVFAYGPGSENFKGVYENTELFKKILEAYSKQ
ncbi:MAG: alkaline phosphatase [Bacteroidetes bacterium]|nr:alkaline phosphatase [Bacteroidota bacterium]